MEYLKGFLVDWENHKWDIPIQCVFYKFIPKFEILNKEIGLSKVLGSKILFEFLKQVEECGLSINTISKLKILDIEKFLNALFPGCKIIDCQHGYDNGHPDFKILPSLLDNDSDEIYIEVKRKNDGIRPNQLKWMLNNYKNKKVYVMHIDDIDYNDFFNKVE